MKSPIDIMKKIEELDEEVSNLVIAEKMDERVKFEYKILEPQPFRVDSQGTKWFRLILKISPIGKFDLKKIEKVVYVLHPTFKPNKVAVSTPENGFSLQIESWGAFNSIAAVFFKSGESKKLSQWLPIGQKSVFFS